jgi:uncharacterized protein
VIVPDINLLLYAHLDSFPEHPLARVWWEQCLSENRDVGIPSTVLFGFIRVATNRRIFDPPMSVESALSVVESWLSRPHVRILSPGPRHLAIAFELLRALGTAANLTTDVQIAALAIEYQAEVHSGDTDFARFPQLRWSNPISRETRG